MNVFIIGEPDYKPHALAVGTMRASETVIRQAESTLATAGFPVAKDQVVVPLLSEKTLFSYTRRLDVYAGLFLVVSEVRAFAPSTGDLVCAGSSLQIGPVNTARRARTRHEPRALKYVADPVSFQVRGRAKNSPELPATVRGVLGETVIKPLIEFRERDLKLAHTLSLDAVESSEQRTRLPTRSCRNMTSFSCKAGNFRCPFSSCESCALEHPSSAAISFWSRSNILSKSLISFSTMINSPRVNLFTSDNVQRIFYIVNKNVQRKMNTPSKDWKQEVFKRILAAYRVGNANVLARILKEKFDVERSTVYAWRDGRSKPTEDLLKKISQDTGEPFAWFLTGNYEQETVSTEANLLTDEGNKESVFTYADFERLWSKYNKLNDDKVKKGISSSLEIMEGFIDRQLENQKLYNRK